jgi:hypothetical protein
MQESNDVSGEKLKLIRKVLGVELFKDEWPANMGRRFGASSLPPRDIRFYSWLRGLMGNFSGEKISCIFTKQPRNLGKAFA